VTDQNRNLGFPVNRDQARIGVSKVNVSSDLRRAYRTTLETQLREHPDKYASVKLHRPRHEILGRSPR
jgi:fructose/tagatose bisphosphate aldolase